MRAHRGVVLGSLWAILLSQGTKLLRIMEGPYERATRLSIRGFHHGSGGAVTNPIKGPSAKIQGIYAKTTITIPNIESQNTYLGLKVIAIS